MRQRGAQGRRRLTAGPRTGSAGPAPAGTLVYVAGRSMGAAWHTSWSISHTVPPRCPRSATAVSFSASARGAPLRAGRARERCQSARAACCCCTAAAPLLRRCCAAAAPLLRCCCTTAALLVHRSQTLGDRTPGLHTPAQQRVCCWPCMHEGRALAMQHGRSEIVFLGPFTCASMRSDELRSFGQPAGRPAGAIIRSSEALRSTVWLCVCQDDKCCVVPGLAILAGVNKHA